MTSWYDMCSCARPIPSGRMYHGEEACRRCGNLIVASKVLRKARAKADAELRSLGARKKRVGGLEPEGQWPTNKRTA